MSSDPGLTNPSLPRSEPYRPAASGWRRLWRYGRALLAPLLIWVLLVGMVFQPLVDWLNSSDVHDEAAMQEWLEEARNADATLADLVEDYVERARRYVAVESGLEAHRLAQRVAVKRQEIYQHLRALGEPATKMYPGQLPLFPVIYRLEIHLDAKGLSGEAGRTLEGGPSLEDPVIWDSGLDPSSGQYRQAVFPLRDVGRVLVRYQLRAWNKRQRDEQLKARRLQQLVLLAVAATILGLAWLMLLQADERRSQEDHERARDRIDQAERERLDEERRRVETERELLEQRLATQAAERKALELKSHLYASIGIMAGSYAHNIKNLLVRPNDLLRRCLERPGVPSDEERMLREVQQTLGTVTERLQQILQTVKRDPSRSELKVHDLEVVLRGLCATWGELAADRWQLDLILEPGGVGPKWIAADESHLHQAIENLLFNARDATFEMRNHLRDDARRSSDLQAPARKQAVIAAAAWRGRVVLRVRREQGQVVLEVIDNGAGMTEEVRKRCTETHFTTKRDNALFAGHSTGMGLGLSFVVAILGNHDARLEIDSTPLAGTTFRVRFPEAKP